MTAGVSGVIGYAYRAGPRPRRFSPPALVALYIGAVGLSLSGCMAPAVVPAQPPPGLATTINTVASDLRSACSEALFVANVAGLVPGVGAIVPYINAGCATAEGLAQLAASPTGVQWVGQLIGTVKALAGARGISL